MPKYMQFKRRPVSISVQISRVVIITAAVAVALTMLAMIAVAAVLAQAASQQRAYTIAELLAASSDVPLVLRDAERGRDVLAALATSDGVVRARLTDRDGKVLANYVHQAQARAAAGNYGSAWLNNFGEVTAKSPVVDGGDTLIPTFMCAA